MIYFELRLSTPNKAGANIENWGVTDQFLQDQRLHYLSFSMKEDLYLLQDGKKIPCEMYHFERNYSLSPHRTFICGFPKTFAGNKEDLTLVLDSDYFELGPLKLFFSAQDLANTPQIKL